MENTNISKAAPDDLSGEVCSDWEANLNLSMQGLKVSESNVRIAFDLKLITRQEFFLLLGKINAEKCRLIQDAAGV